jgi:predicted acylesterase/phospholipase RssA
MNTASTAPPDRFCDLVMKGGITSGIVYPPAIVELAKHYRFKSIGGTSAGAIAAAVTAAAEYQRRCASVDTGFALLARMPSRMGDAVPGGQSGLLSLFQPDPPCRRLFSLLVGSLNRANTYTRIAAIAFGFVRAYWPATLLSVGAGALVAWIDSWLSGVLVLIAALVISIGYWAYRDITRAVVKNNYGLCKGMTVHKKGKPEALTPWLHALIQEAAGRKTGDAPLTFGDLWGAPGFPSWVAPAPGARRKSIDLQMFTTNLAHGRPYILPHAEAKARLFYERSELAEYLPEKVMEWIEAHAVPYARSVESPDSDPDPDIASRHGLKELPAAEHFPVLLAARMSLSFPVLFSAVPLWAIDYDPPRGKRTFKRCMFSDGGICSNFPMHLFDGLVPMWPTFGIQLEPKLPERPNMTFLPQRYEEGYGERWYRFDDENAGAASRLGGFLGAIVNTMQNWNDNTLSRMAGVRDRVVRLRLEDDEGGLNLNMSKTLIDAVAQRGGTAGRDLVDRFVPEGSSTTTRGWDEQRWVRLDVLLQLLEMRLPGAAAAITQSIPHAKSYGALVTEAQTTAPPGHAHPLTATQAGALQVLLDALESASTSFDRSRPAYSWEPAPPADLRVRPPL